MTIYLCKDQFEDILCAIYDAWNSRLGHDNVKVQVENQGNLELFSEYIYAVTDEGKVNKVIKAVREKISEDAFEAVYKAALSVDVNKADWIYRFLILGFVHGSQIIHMLSLEPVYEVFRMARYVSNENHLHTGFVRFSQMQQGILLSKIQPKNHILPMLAVFFADRMPGEHWIIYDENRQLAVFHKADGGWAITAIQSDEWKHKLLEDTDEEMYQQLWSAFFHTVAIKERINPNCQRNHLPLRYRGNMPEFRK